MGIGRSQQQHQLLDKENREKAREESKNTLFFHVSETKQESADYLARSEQIDSYLTTCFKSGGQNGNIRREYFPAIIDKETIKKTYNYLTGIYAQIPEKLRTELKEVVIVYMMPTADEGLPHTRPQNVICLPFAANMPDIEVIIHELWHIHQRQNRGMWRDYYEKEWNCRPVSNDVKGAIMKTEIGKNMRLNPDTIDEPLWIWKDEWVPVCVFANPISTGQGRLRDTMVRIYNVKTGNYYGQYPEWFRMKFIATDLEHGGENPNELSAYILQKSRV